MAAEKTGVLRTYRILQDIYKLHVPEAEKFQARAKIDQGEDPVKVFDELQAKAKEAPQVLFFA